MSSDLTISTTVSKTSFTPSFCVLVCNRTYRTLTRACVTLLAASFQWPVLVDTLRTGEWKQQTKLTSCFFLTIRLEQISPKSSSLTS